MTEGGRGGEAERTERTAGGVRGVTLSAAKGLVSRHALVVRSPSFVRPLRPRRSALHAQSLPQRLDRRLDAPPFDRAPLGRRAGGREGDAGLRPEPAAALHPGQQHQDRGGGGGVGAAAARLDGADQPLRRRAGGRTACCRATWCSTAGAIRRFGKRCFATDTLREGACETDSFTRLRELADGLRARGIREIHGDLVGDGSYFEPLLVHPGWEAFDLNWWYAAPVSALGFNDNSVDFTWGPGTAPGTPAVITMSPDVGRRGVREPHRDGAGGRPRRTSATGSSASRARSTSGPRARPRSTGRRSTESFAMPRPEPVHRAGAAAGAAGGRDRDHRHHPLDHRLDALPPGPEHAAARRDHVAPAPRVDLPDPQPQPELVRRDGAQAARPAVRPRRDRGPRGWRSSAGS